MKLNFDFAGTVKTYKPEEWAQVDTRSRAFLKKHASHEGRATLEQVTALRMLTTSTEKKLERQYAKGGQERSNE